MSINKQCKLLIVGHGRAGKDTAGDYLATITNLKFAGTTSKYLTKYVAKELGIPEEEAYKDRHNNREFWFNLGNKIREEDPLKLINEAFADGDITGGIRDKAEIDAVQKQDGILVLWIENNRVPIDPTVRFSKDDCDLIIENNDSLDSFYCKLRKFAKFAGIIKEPYYPLDIKVSIDLNREQLFEFGRQGIFHEDD